MWISIILREEHLMWYSIYKSINKYTISYTILYKVRQIGETT
jgi:hypothetical protein